MSTGFTRLHREPAILNAWRENAGSGYKIEVLCLTIYRMHGRVVRALMSQPDGPRFGPRSGHRNCIYLGLGLDTKQFPDHAL